MIVERLKLNYAMNDENPVDHVKFYNQYKPDEGHYLVTLTHYFRHLLIYLILYIVFNLSRSQVSYLVPEQYEEINTRIFARDPEKVNLQYI